MNGYSTGTGQTAELQRDRLRLPDHAGDRRLRRWCSRRVMGLVGGLLPAFRGARLPITSALREA